MRFKLKKQKYDWRHFLLIPFQCEPLGTAGVSLQKLLTALAAVFQVPAAAKFIDNAIAVAKGTGSYQTTVIWLLLLMLCVGWRRVSYFVGRIFTGRVTVFSEKNMLEELTDKRSRLAYEHIEDAASWDLIQRVCKDVDRMVNTMVQRCLNIVLYVIRIVGVLIVISTQVWWIGALVLVLSLPLMFMSFKSGGKNYNAIKLAAEHDRKQQYFSETLSGREAVDERTLFGYSDAVNDVWYEQYETSRKISFKANVAWTTHIFMSSGITSVFSGIIMLALVHPAVTGQITLGMFMALSAGVYDLIDLMGWQMVRGVSELAKSREYLRDLTAFAALSETDGATDNPEETAVPCKTIEFRNVSFRYPRTEAYILKNTSFRLEQGRHYAFVGSNGAGKTTITKLMTGLYAGYEGDILINGKNIREYPQARLKSLFVGVYQDFAKYFISVRQNIMVGDIKNIGNDTRMADVKAITENLGIYDEIDSMPDKFDTPLGKIEKGGLDISGGQWQKLAMARATVSPASVQILDEPTAALDPLSESRLYEQFYEISKGKTTIFISHRLGSTKLADHIFVLDGGRIAEEGSHEHLMRLGGIYAEMYDSQRSWYQ